MAESKHWDPYSTRKINLGQTSANRYQSQIKSKELSTDENLFKEKKSLKSKVLE